MVTILSELVLIIIMVFPRILILVQNILIYLLEILNTILQGWRHCHIFAYTLAGILMVEDEIEFSLDSEPVAASPQFTLTCVSTGGPATTVTWTRGSEDVPGETMTVLNNATTARYTHTLTVTGRLGGLYQCTVSNNIPSEDSTSITLDGEYY